MRLNHVLVLCVSLALTSCRFFGDKVNGDGHITSQQRNIGNFNSVEVSGSVKVHIRQDPAHSVKLETDANLMEHIDVFTEGNTLVIREKDNVRLNPTKDIVVFIAAPAFEAIDVSGACDIIGDGTISGTGDLEMQVSGSGEISMDVNMRKVATEISGSGTIKLRGKANEFLADISGSGEVKCFDLQTEKTSLDLSGAADAEVSASRELDIKASGASSITYKGNPTINQRISGSGSVKKVG